jgi:hypothetical protein
LLVYKVQQKLSPSKDRGELVEEEDVLEEEVNDRGVEMEEEMQAVRTKPRVVSVETWNEDAVNFEKQCQLGLSEVNRVSHVEERLAAAQALEETSVWQCNDLKRRFDELPAKDGAVMTPARLEELRAKLALDLDSSICHIDRSLGGIGFHSRPSSATSCAFCKNQYGTMQRFAGACYSCGKEGCIGCVLSMSLFEALEDRPGVTLVCVECAPSLESALSCVTGVESSARSREAQRQMFALSNAKRGLVVRGTGRALLEADGLAAIIQGFACKRKRCFFLVCVLFFFFKKNPCRSREMFRLFGKVFSCKASANLRRLFETCVRSRFGRLLFACLGFSTVQT